MQPSLHRLICAALLFVALCACSPTDRSGEQPFAPTVKTLTATAEGDKAVLTGQVTATPNSPLEACGFAYGNDTLLLDTLAPAPSMLFSATTDSLGPGRYYAVAFARNGMGTSHGDTLFFTIGN